MAKAVAIPRTAFPDVVLELDPSEARALVEYLSIHSTKSSIDTYSIFAALSDALEYPSIKKSIEIMHRVELTADGVIKIRSVDE